MMVVYVDAEASHVYPIPFYSRINYCTIVAIWKGTQGDPIFIE